MMENVPPNSASKPANTTGTTNATPNNTNNDRPGLPYYEKLRRDLRDTLAKKRTLDRNLAAIEDQIFRSETSYLEETSTAGNIVKGFDNYIKASAASSSANTGAGTISGSAAGGTRRKALISETDRVFSKSSVSYGNRTDSENGNTGASSSAVSTPAGVGTPTGAGGSFAEKDGPGRKKKKKIKDADNDDATTTDADTGRTTKRQKISYAARKGHDD